MERLPTLILKEPCIQLYVRFFCRFSFQVAYVLNLFHETAIEILYMVLSISP